jgi:hypothetical protein
MLSLPRCRRSTPRSSGLNPPVMPLLSPLCGIRKPVETIRVRVVAARNTRSAAARTDGAVQGWPRLSWPPLSLPILLREGCGPEQHSEHTPDCIAHPISGPNDDPSGSGRTASSPGVAFKRFPRNPIGNINVDGGQTKFRKTTVEHDDSLMDRRFRQDGVVNKPPPPPDTRADRSPGRQGAERARRSLHRWPGASAGGSGRAHARSLSVHKYPCPSG